MSLVDLRVTTEAATRRAGPLGRLWNGPQSSAGRRAALSAITAAGSAALTVLFFNNPADGRHRLFPPCPFHAVTGCYCPGCGSTRAVYQLLHGHPAAAIALNPLMVLSVPYLAYAYLSYSARVAFPRSSWANPSRDPIKAHWIWAVLILICLFWLLRNAPVYPFTLLAPH